MLKALIGVPLAAVTARAAVKSNWLVNRKHGIAIRFVKEWIPVESLYYQWTEAIYTDQQTYRIVLRGDAYRSFLERMHEYDYPSEEDFQIVGISERLRLGPMPAHADGWAFGRAWYITPIPVRVEG